MSAQDLRFELDDGVNGGAQLQVVVPALGAAVATVRPEHMERATPCASWSMRDLLNHIVGGALMFADAFGGAPVRDISGRLPDVVGDDPSTAFGEAAARFGAALAGSKPVLEFQFSDFAALAMEQIVNQAAKLRYMLGGEAAVPVVVPARPQPVPALVEAA